MFNLIEKHKTKTKNKILTSAYIISYKKLNNYTTFVMQHLNQTNGMYSVEHLYLNGCAILNV